MHNENNTSTRTGVLPLQAVLAAAKWLLYAPLLKVDQGEKSDPPDEIDSAPFALHAQSYAHWLEISGCQ